MKQNNTDIICMTIVWSSHMDKFYFFRNIKWIFINMDYIFILIVLITILLSIWFGSNYSHYIATSILVILHVIYYERYVAEHFIDIEAAQNIANQYNTGDVTVKNLKVTGNADVTGNVTIGGNIKTRGSAAFDGSFLAPQVCLLRNAYAHTDLANYGCSLLY